MSFRCSAGRAHILRGSRPSSIGVQMASRAPSALPKTQDLSGYLRWVQKLNTGEDALQSRELLPLTVGGSTLGYMPQRFAQHLCRFPATFTVTDAAAAVSPELRTPEQRTAAVGDVLAALRKEGVVTGWRDELYPVVSSFSAEPSFLVERAAAALFGIKAYGPYPSLSFCSFL
jgi:hypothetical protein